jgi:hypothetical protein
MVGRERERKETWEESGRQVVEEWSKRPKVRGEW